MSGDLGREVCLGEHEEYSVKVLEKWSGGTAWSWPCGFGCRQGELGGVGGACDEEGNRYQDPP